MHSHELRNINTVALQEKLNALLVDFNSAKEAVKSGSEKNHAKLKNLRRDIARVQTIIREKEKTSEGKFK